MFVASRYATERLASANYYTKRWNGFPFRRLFYDVLQKPQYNDQLVRCCPLQQVLDFLDDVFFRVFHFVLHFSTKIFFIFRSHLPLLLFAIWLTI